MPRAAVYLRRYAYSFGQCPGPMGFHDGTIYLGEYPINLLEDGCWEQSEHPEIPHGDPRWPTHCTCGQAFTEKDEWQYFHDRIYSDGTRSWPKRELPVGAMFYADWYPKNMYWDNKEDDHLIVITPDGDWNIDGRASNCTLPNDRLHRCWVRHGTPPDIHVDKAGRTCSAGAGSFSKQRYHGFLHHGSLTSSM